MSTVVVNVVRRSFYLDSVMLMRLAREIGALPGVGEAALMMATPANKGILQEAGLLRSDGEGAAANDLIIAVRARSADEATAALGMAAKMLEAPRTPAKGSTVLRPRTLRSALRVSPNATLALISVPGDHAVREARKAIRAGLDVMIFSSNVPVEEEVALKREAKALGRLVMGPDCGTAIIGGVPLAFANRVPRGDIGVIGASGTGMQEIISLIAQNGRGVSQAIGVGSRDLGREVGGISTLMAIDLLDADPQTGHIVLISKPPHADSARAVLARVDQSRKSFTVCFLGAGEMPVPKNARSVPTLRAAAEDALGSPLFASRGVREDLTRRPGAIAGLFCGGTLGSEAQLILLAAGRHVESNAPVPGAKPLGNAASGADRIIDLGADEFTRGRPHPMIDPTLRNAMLRSTSKDAGVAAILIDMVIGLGTHPDPAAEAVAALSSTGKGRPYVIASVTGTEADPQVRSRQIATLERAGVIVAPSNADAAKLALALSNQG
jgi:FdrA protein